MKNRVEKIKKYSSSHRARANFILLFAFLTLFSIPKLFPQSPSGMNINVLSLNQKELDNFGIKIVKNSLEIADSLGSAKKINFRKIVVGNKRVALKSKKKNESFDNIISPKLVVYKFKNGTSAFYRNSTIYHAIDENAENTQHIDGIEKWIAVKINLPEKNNSVSEVYIWYEPIAETLAKLSDSSKDIVNSQIKKDDNLVHNIEIQNIFPNPTNSKATVTLNLKENSIIKIDLFDIAGRIVAPDILAATKYDAGIQNIDIDVSSLQSGMYFVVVRRENGETSSGRIVVLK
ncbi:MAG: T9SS type A sorting domain-containing protein [Candidatus Kapabacteria bacterium]|nr:T9SS type A sorting domain-containing protein [Candidatus Kapabacteria bacterium]